MDTVIIKQNNNKKSRYCTFEKNLKRLASVKPNQLDNIKIPREEAIAQGFKKMVNDGEAQLYFELLMHLYSQRCKKILSSPRYLTALARICFFRDKFVNDISTWKRPNAYIDKQFPSLLRHLFAKYEMPLFFDHVWFTDDSIHQTWYTEVAQGKNIRKCERLPIELSKKMSFYFMSTPARLDINDAFKWTQLMILGGDAYLADQIIRSNFDGEIRMPQQLWEETILFLANNVRIPMAKIREVFDFIAFHGRNVAEFSLRGRTVASLMRLSDEWHQTIAEAEAAKARVEPIITWEKSDISDDVFRLSKQNKRLKIEVIELMNSIQLAQEGKKMRHCVGGYSNSCKTRYVAIFSIRNGLSTLATIEVRLRDRKIVQAKAKCNKSLSETAEKVMRSWAARNRLEIAEDL